MLVFVGNVGSRAYFGSLYRPLIRSTATTTGLLPTTLTPISSCHPARMAASTTGTEHLHLRDIKSPVAKRHDLRSTPQISRAGQVGLASFSQPGIGALDGPDGLSRIRHPAVRMSMAETIRAPLIFVVLLSRPWV